MQEKYSGKEWKGERGEGGLEKGNQGEKKIQQWKTNREEEKANLSGAPQSTRREFSFVVCENVSLPTLLLTLPRLSVLLFFPLSLSFPAPRSLRVGVRMPKPENSFDASQPLFRPG